MKLTKVKLVVLVAATSLLFSFASALAEGIEEPFNYVQGRIGI